MRIIPQQNRFIKKGWHCWLNARTKISCKSFYAFSLNVQKKQIF